MFTVAQKIEFLQEHGYWDNPANDLTPPELVEYIEMIMLANNLTDDDLALHIKPELSSNPDLQTEEPITNIVNQHTDGILRLSSEISNTGISVERTSGTLDFRDTSYATLEHKPLDADGVKADQPEFDVTLNAQARSYDQCIHDWLVHRPEDYPQGRTIAIHVLGVDLQPTAIGKIVTAIATTRNLSIDWHTSSHGDRYPVFTIASEGESYFTTTVRVLIQLD